MIVIFYAYFIIIYNIKMNTKIKIKIVVTKIN
jgi:hypothetical protein